MILILTCEHGGNKIPTKFRPYFTNTSTCLTTHRGYDWGALDMFSHLEPLAKCSAQQTVSRLLVEMNRSLEHPELFSEFSKNMSSEEKREVLETYYLPYRTKIEDTIKNCIEIGRPVLHLSIHSFTPVLNGETRNIDIGLLFDPNRSMEKEFCGKLKIQCQKRLPDLKIKMNYPYLGTDDGLTTSLRKLFPTNYMGIELEFNQKFSVKNQMHPRLKSTVFSAIEILIKPLKF